MSADTNDIALRHRADFPQLSAQVHGHPLIYLDNAATTQRPRSVVDAEMRVYLEHNANVHRGVHYLSQLATEAHEHAREIAARFIGAKTAREVIFTRGTTEGLNLIASSAGEAFLKEGDEVVLTQMEHHSNIVPWQLLRERRGVVLKVVPVADDGTLDLDAYRALLSERTRLVSLAHMSNVLGTVNPVADMARMAHDAGALVVVDAAQSVAHQPIDVDSLGADFLCFSAHKIYGPTGVGIVWGREKWLEQMPPYQGGGEMIAHVSFEKTTYERLPFKFEAGTPNFAGSVGLGAALEYVERIGLERIAESEARLTRHALERLSAISGLHIYGHAPRRGSVVAFNIEGIHHLDLGTLLDQLGIAVRTGHHCAEPLMHRFGTEGMVRASMAFYNTTAEIDALAAALERIKKMF